MLRADLETRFEMLLDLNFFVVHLSCPTFAASVVLVSFVRAGRLRMQHADLELLQTRRELEVVPALVLCFDLYARVVSAVDLVPRRSELDYGMSRFLLYV